MQKNTHAYRPQFLVILLASLLMVNHSSFASDLLSVGLGQDGYTGLSNTPIANINSGQMGLQWSPRVIGYSRHDGNNFSTAIGLNEGLEVGGRIAGNTWTGSAYAPGNDIGLRDLSGSFKLNLNAIFDVKLPVQFAVGEVDIGGAATNFRSQYGVATYQSDKLLLSLGESRAGSLNTQKVLSGPFANGKWAVLPWLSAQLESTQDRSWAGIKAQADWLGVKPYFEVNQQLKGSDVVGSKAWLTLGVSIPLGGRDHVSPSNDGHGFLQSSDKPRTSPVLNESIQIISKESSIDSSLAKEMALSGPSGQSKSELIRADKNVSLSPSEMNFDVDQLLRSLLEKGFERVSVGWANESSQPEPRLVVSVNDSVYLRSQLDGLGVALGVIADSSWRGSYRLVIERWGTPVQSAEGQSTCLWQWLHHNASCTEHETLEITRSNPGANLDSARWVIKNQSPDTFKPRINLAPIYTYYIATEVGMFDYSLGLDMNPQVHLWPGAVFEFSHLTPLMQTNNFKADQIFGLARIPHTTERVMLHQMQKLPLGFSIRASAGNIFSNEYQGFQTELRYDQDKGPWAAGVTLSQWKSIVAGYSDTRHPSTGFVRYSVPNRAWNLEAQFGEYWFKDQGLTLMSRHWFGDTSVALYVRRSIPQAVIWSGDRSVNLAGLEVTFPLTPSREMNSDFFQVRGNPQQSFSIFTQVAKSNNQVVDQNGVPVQFRVFVDAPAPFTLGSTLEDYDRAVFERSEIERVRVAYERFNK